jgi:hypothetical protein
MPMPIEYVPALDNTLSAERAFLTERITTLGPSVVLSDGPLQSLMQAVS